MKRFLNKLASWTLGFSLGAGTSAALIAIFSPVSAETVRGRLQQRYHEAKVEARLAAQRERARLEAQLTDMTNGNVDIRS
jgi:hypothetical protein